MAGTASKNVGVFRRRPDYYLVLRRLRRKPITITAPPEAELTGGSVGV